MPKSFLQTFVYVVDESFHDTVQLVVNQCFIVIRTIQTRNANESKVHRFINQPQVDYEIPSE